METETQAQCILQCEEHHCLGNNLPNGEGKGLFVPSSSKEVQKPGKRPTRQWAAWTREEEESFFTALRQVGKNFEKITSRVQSKNKDQVRHYYYRLVRRMNKLLGPGFLDAKNSKDTNAAMLRWWSLLEKYSCKASKLHHLKPRRFKVFIGTLEHQLLKDRKKNVRKRPCQAENCPPLPSRAMPNQNKLSGNETRAVKFVLVDSQNIQKMGNGRGSTMKHNANVGVNQSRGDLSPTKASRQRRKSGGALSAAAVKKWEKAAIAGMSLVAEAAEHIERTAGGRGAQSCGALISSSPKPATCNNGERGLELTGQNISNGPNFACNVPREKSTQDITKLKLQLFPIDNATRRTLEMDKHNPYLELTLSTRKKIASVLEHLNKKWGNSAAACGEMMLFPYTAENDGSFHCERWTQNSLVTAADVYAAIGSPPVFRLRYGWISTSDLRSSLSSSCSSDKQDMNIVNQEYLCANPAATPKSWDHQFGTTLSSGDDMEALTAQISAVGPPSTDCTFDTNRDEGFGGLRHGSFGAAMLLQRSEAPAEHVARKIGAEVMANIPTQPASVWTDSITNISVGDLLADDVNANCDAAREAGRSHCSEEAPFTCDSFDAAIAAHMLKHQNKMGYHSPTTTSHPLTSIWDAEETCDAFSFQNRSSINIDVQAPSLPVTSACLKDLPEEEMGDADTDTDAKGDPMEEEGPSENSPKDVNSLKDVYWPDSLGPLDLEELCSSRRYYSQEVVFSDSLSGLSRLIASSLDAFQNCSFFSLENKKDAEGPPAGKDSLSGCPFPIIGPM